MNDQYTISVVIPHHRDFLALALSVQSAVSQSLQPLEIIIVNDDDEHFHPNQLEQLLISSECIRVFETGCCSGGPAQPRNSAIDLSRGRYVAFLDADDIWLPNHLENLAKLWHLSPNAILHGHQLCWGQGLHRPFFQAGLSTGDTPLSTLRQLRRFGNKIFMSTVGAPTELLKRYKFDCDLLWEDFDLWLRLAADGYPFINSNSCTTLYQIRKGSRSGRREARKEASQQMISKYFDGRPFFLLPPWLLRNLYF